MSWPRPRAPDRAEATARGFTFRPRSTGSSLVAMEAPAGLLAQVARRDELLEDLRRSKLLLPQALVQDAHDPEHDVQADEIRESQRSHRMVESDAGSGVDVLRRTQALLVGPHRLGEQR